MAAEIQIESFDVDHADGTTHTLTNDVGSTSSAFVQMLSGGSRSTGSGPTGSTGNTNPDDACGAVALTDTDELTFYSGTATTRKAMGQVWRYTGSSGGANEFINRGSYAITLSGVSQTQSVAGIANESDCVPILNGVTAASGGVSDYENFTIKVYMDGNENVVVQRNAADITVTVYVTVIEFKGSAWKIGHAAVPPTALNVAGTTNGVSTTASLVADPTGGGTYALVTLAAELAGDDSWSGTLGSGTLGLSGGYTSANGETWYTGNDVSLAWPDNSLYADAVNWACIVRFRADSIPSSGNYATLWSEGGGTNGMTLAVTDTGAIRAYFYVSSGADGIEVESDPISTGTYYSVGLRLVNGVLRMRLAEDGGEIDLYNGSDVGSGFTTWAGHSGNANLGTQSDEYFDSSTNSASSVDWDGLIRDWRVYHNTTVSSETISGIIQDPNYDPSGGSMPIDINDWNTAFIVGTLGGDTSETGLSDTFICYRPGSTTDTVDVYFHCDAGARNDNGAFCHVIQHDDLAVYRDWDTNHAEGNGSYSTDINWPSGAPTDKSLDDLAVEWFSDTSGTGTAHARGALGVQITDATGSARSWIHRSGNNVAVSFGVIDLSGIVASAPTYGIAHRASGTFTGKPTKVKVNGTFTEYPIKVKVGGTFI